MDIKYGLISVDDHVHEHTQVWTQRMSRSRWGDKVPHLESQPDGGDCWAVGGQKLPLSSLSDVGATLPDRSTRLEKWEEVPRAAYDPAERLKAMDADGVDYSVLYPTVAGLAGETFGRITDPELELACVQAYNDWLVEEWAGVSARFIPQCIVPLAPTNAIVQEIKRAFQMGHKGVVFPAMPWHLRDLPHINDPYYDPVWSTCQELGVPICLHAGASPRIQFPPYPGLSEGVTAALAAITAPVSSVMVVANLLFSRILLRYPELKVIFAESTLAWGAYELETADHQFERQRLHLEGYDLKPSEMFRRQCYLTGWYDRSALETRRFFGVENMLWGTNFPLETSTWPTTRDYVARSFNGVPEDERSRVLWGNASRLYKLD